MRKQVDLDGKWWLEAHADDGTVVSLANLVEGVYEVLVEGPREPRGRTPVPRRSGQPGARPVREVPHLLPAPCRGTLTAAMTPRDTVQDKMMGPPAPLPKGANTMRRVVHVGPAARRRSKINLRKIHVMVVPDDDPDTSYLEQEGFEDRLAQYQNGDFYFVGVRAEAEVEIDSVAQTLTSAGLWGVESDLDEIEFNHSAGEEWSALREILLTIGVPSDQIPQQFERLEWRA